MKRRSLWHRTHLISSLSHNRCCPLPIISFRLNSLTQLKAVANVPPMFTAFFSAVAFPLSVLWSIAPSAFRAAMSSSGLLSNRETGFAYSYRSATMGSTRVARRAGT